MRKTPGTMLKVGLLLNIILSALSVIATVVIVIMFDKILENASGITVEQKAHLIEHKTMYITLLIVSNGLIPAAGGWLSYKAMTEEKYKLVAGIFGVLTNLVAGILILVGKYLDDNNNYNMNQNNNGTL